MNIKFDILGTKIAQVQVTEEVVLGKERPKYFYSDGEPFGSRNSGSNSSCSSQRTKSLCQATLSKSLASFHKPSCNVNKDYPNLAPIKEERPIYSRRNTIADLNDFDMRIFEELEL